MSLCHQSWLHYPMSFLSLALSVIVFPPLMPVIFGYLSLAWDPPQATPSAVWGTQMDRLFMHFELWFHVLQQPVTEVMAVCSCPLVPSYGGYVWKPRRVSSMISRNLGRWHHSFWLIAGHHWALVLILCIKQLVTTVFSLSPTWVHSEVMCYRGDRNDGRQHAPSHLTPIVYLNFDQTYKTVWV